MLPSLALTVQMQLAANVDTVESRAIVKVATIALSDAPICDLFRAVFVATADNAITGAMLTSLDDWREADADGDCPDWRRWFASDLLSLACAAAVSEAA